MVRLKKLEIENFLSIADMTIEFTEQGVFHVDGNHNIGKSNIIKAINTLFRNVNNLKYTKYIRDNETTFVIRGTFYDGGVVTLSRGEEDYYEWDIPGNKGMSSSRTNGKVPPVLVKYFNLYIDNEKTKECLNIRLPRETLLYVDTTEGDNYHLIQQALGTSEFIQATRLAGQKKNDISKHIRKTEERLAQDESYIEGYILDSNRKQTEYENAKVRLEGIEKLYADYKLLSEVVVTTHKIGELTKGIEELGTVEEVTTELPELKKEITELELLRSALLLRRNLLTLEEEQTQLEEEKGKVDISEELVTELKLLEETVKLLEEKEKLDNELSEIVVDVDEATLEKDLAELQELVHYIQLMKELQSIKKNHEDAKQAHEQSEQELTDFMKENNFCPIVAMRSDRTCPFSSEIKLG